MSLFSLKGASRWTLGITLSLLVAGCSSMGGFKTQGCVGGAVAGGAIGALISAEGAIIGAIGGCVAGLFVGHYFEERKKQYASQQQAIIEETAWNRKMAQKLRQTNAELAKSIRQYKQEVERIENMAMNEKQREWVKREQKKIFQQQFSGALDAAGRVKVEVDKSKEQYQQHQAGANPAKLEEWDAEMTAFEEEGKRLNDKLNRLVAMNDSL
ncbi:MAG: glycine zipper domain-containing protein [Pseudomonadota bacterium]